MASICKETLVTRPATEVWDAIRDVASVDKRLAPGFVKECRMDGNDRIVAFANGFVVREVIMDVDDEARRLAYSALSERLKHHSAYFQIHEDGPGRCRLVWRAYVQPEEAAKTVAAMMEEGAAVMKKTLEAARKSG